MPILRRAVNTLDAEGTHWILRAVTSPLEPRITSSLVIFIETYNLLLVKVTVLFYELRWSEGTTLYKGKTVSSRNGGYQTENITGRKHR